MDAGDVLGGECHQPAIPSPPPPFPPCSRCSLPPPQGVAVLPQLVLFQRKGGEIEPFTSHFVVGLGVGRLLSLLFWVSSYHELNDRYVAASLSG